MVNLKNDLQSKVKNEKYYTELELVRLAKDPSMNYKEKVDQMHGILREIAIQNAQMELIEQYFQDAPPKTQEGQQPQPEQQQKQQQPAPAAHQGQTHGE